MVLVAASSADDTIRLWDVKIVKEIQPFDKTQGAIILKGEFINQSAVDLRTLFKQKGSCVLENLLELK